MGLYCHLLDFSINFGDEVPDVCVVESSEGSDVTALLSSTALRYFFFYFFLERLIMMAS